MKFANVIGYIKDLYERGTKTVSISKFQEGGDSLTAMNCFAPGIEINPANNENIVITQIKNSTSFIVSVGGINQNIEPDTNRGERRIYSVSEDGRTIKAVAKFKNDGTLELNGADSYAVKFEELETALNSFKTSVNNQFLTKLDGAGSIGGATVNITPAKSDSVKLS